MNEPFTTTNTIDETRGIVANPSDSGLKIFMPIVAPTGPTDRTLLAGNNDLAEKFLVASKVYAGDDKSIHHASKILNSSPLYVKRVEGGQMRFGIGSMGAPIITDLEFNPFDSLCKWSMSLDKAYNPTVIFAIVGVTGYYMGESDDLPNDFPEGPTELGSDDTPSVENFFAYLSTATGLDCVMNNNGKFVSYDSMAEPSDDYYNLVNFKTSTFTDRFTKVVGSQNNSNVVIEGDYLTVGSYSMYNWGQGSATITGMANPIPLHIVSNPAFTGPAKGDVPPYAFFCHAADMLMSSGNFKYPDGINIALTNVLTSAALDTNDDITMSDNLKPYVSATIDGATQATLVVKGGFTQFENMWIRIPTTENTDIVFYFGTPPTQQAGDRRVLLNNFIDSSSLWDTMSPTLFVEMIQEYVYDESSPHVTASAITASAIEILYETLSKPTMMIEVENSTSMSINVESGGVTSYEYHYPTDEENSSLHEYENLYLKIGDRVFYCEDYSGPAATEEIRLSASAQTLESFFDLLVTALPQYYTIAPFGTGGFYIANIAGSDISVEESISQTKIDIDQTLYGDDFAMIPRFSCSQDLFKFGYTRTGESDAYVFAMVLEYNGNEVEFDISFNDTVIDGYGNNLYYERINDPTTGSENFECIPLDGSDSLSSFESRLYGSDLNVLTPSVSDIASAVEEMKDYEDVYYDLVMDGGYGHPTVAAALVSLADHFFGLYPFSFDPTITNYSELITMRGNLSTSNRIKLDAGGNRDSSIGDFSVKLPASVYYAKRIIDNTGTISDEFAPAFGPSGVLEMGSLIKNFKKTNRETLLDYQINSAYKALTDVRLNMNLTGQSVSSFLQEEQITRMNNKICQIADAYGKGLYAKINNEDRRLRVETQLLSLLSNRMFTGKGEFTVSGIQVTCNDVNNPTTLINARKIRYDVYAQYLPSIAYVLVYSHVQPLVS